MVGTGNAIGGTATGAGNVVSGQTEDAGIYLAYSARDVEPDGTIDNGSNTVQGNKVGTDVSGTVAVPNYNGIVVTSPNNTIGGATMEAGNLISGNTVYAVQTALDPTVGTVIQGNRIGTDATGEVGMGSLYGIAVITGYEAEADPGPGTQILDNLVADHTIGLELQGPDIVVRGNEVGLSGSGAPLGNDLTGIRLTNTLRAAIGGTNPGDRNEIAHSGSDGIQVSRPSPPARFEETRSTTTAAAPTTCPSIWSALKDPPRTTPSTSTTGPTDSGRASVVAEATATVASTYVTVSLSSSANASFDVDIFGACLWSHRPRRRSHLPRINCGPHQWRGNSSQEDHTRRRTRRVDGLHDRDRASGYV